MAGHLAGGRLPAAYMVPGTSSFADFLAGQAPDLLPSRRSLPPGHAADLAPHGTTIVAATFPDGVVMAGDRRATMGNVIAQRDIEKVFPADEFSVVGIAGSAGLAVEMVRLFQTELEHYEKIEGITLSMAGKANRLAALIRSNLGMAMQGLAVVPLFAGYDRRRAEGRLFEYDVTGGRYEEQAYATSGSGGMHAATVVKLGYREAADRDTTVDLAFRALLTAAEEDSATGGADPVRGIWPIIATIDSDGFARLSDDEMAERYARLSQEIRP